jgi:DNA repair exonuclease SbcCD ATPase subunit
MTTPTMPGPWAADEAPGPACHLGLREAPCSLLPAAGACDAHRALVAERDALCAECERLRERVQNEEQVQAGMTDQALDLAAENNRLHISLGRLLRAAQSLHRAWRWEREQAYAAAERSAKRQKDAESALEMYANAWHRELGDPIVPKMHHIDAMVLTTRSRVVALKVVQADNARLRAELAALVQVGEKLRQDLDRLSGQALDLGRDTGRIHRALDEAQVPKTNPEPGRPWRIDDRVQWALERLKTTGGLVDRLEGQLAETGAELADVKHQLARLQLSACRLVAVNGGRA